MKKKIINKKCISLPQHFVLAWLSVLPRVFVPLGPKALKREEGVGARQELEVGSNLRRRNLQIRMLVTAKTK